MSHRTHRRSRRVAGLVSIAATASIALTGTARAGQGPVCEDNEEPVCEEPPPPPSPPSSPRGFVTVYVPDFGPELLGVTFRLVLV